MTAFLTSFVVVVLAEMGDKTQLLAMAFATRYPAPIVLAGIFVATAANHALAVAAGATLTAFIPMTAVQGAAALSFLAFGVWTLRPDALEGEEKRSLSSPFRTVVVGFFLAEMGDKTQLATMALAAGENAPVAVWLGTNAGMLVADAVGIVVGVLLGHRLPETALRWTAAALFVLFGLAGLAQLVPDPWRWPGVAGAAAVTALAGWLLLRRKAGEQPTPLPPA